VQAGRQVNGDEVRERLHVKQTDGTRQA